EFTLFNQHHRDCRGIGFGRGSNLKERVAVHQQWVVDVCDAKARCVLLTIVENADTDTWYAKFLARVINCGAVRLEARLPFDSVLRHPCSNFLFGSGLTVDS